MHALILASGKGTHLRPLTVYTPKPILPIINRPLLLYQIEILKRAGVKEIVLFLDYQPDKIEHLLGDERELGIKLRFVVEPRPLGSAGAFKFASDEFTETAIVFNGDILTDFIISKALKQHHQTSALATVALTSGACSGAFGVGIDENNRITSFDTKIENAAPNLSDSGIYILEPEIRETIADENNISFEKDIFPKLLKQDEKIYGYEFKKGYWCAIDSIENYRNINQDFLAGKIHNFKNSEKNAFERATTAFIDEASIIGNDCVVKANAKIINSVLGRGVQVEENAVVKNSIVWSHSRISSRATIEGTILTRSCYVGKNVSVSKGAVLGDKTSLTDYTKV